MNLTSAAACLALGLAFVFLTWQARKSGEIQLRTSTLLRAESPSTFQIVLILRGLAGILLIAFAIWTVLQRRPTG
jgi:hypothetical protein